MRGLLLLLMLATLTACGAMGPGNESGSPLSPDGAQVRLRVVDPQGAGSAIQWQGETLHVREPSLISRADLRDVRMAVTNGEPMVNIRLGPDAGKRLQAATAGLVGQRLALTVDEQVVTVATVAGPFGESLQVSGGGTLAETHDMVQRIIGGKGRQRAR